MSEEEVRELLKRTVPAINWAEVSPRESWTEVGLDSLDKVTVVMEFETALSRKIDDERYEEIDTIEDMVAFSA